jgi:hypothetical protein
MTDASPRFALPLLQSGQAQKEVFHNEALTSIDTLLHLAVASIGTDTPPTATTIGDAWIVGATPQGVWTGLAGQIASWTGGGWRFLKPRAGMTAWLLDLGRWAWHDGYGWRSDAMPSNGLAVSGKRVVSVQQPAINDPAGGLTVDSEVRVATAPILAAMRQHGLISN